MGAYWAEFLRGFDAIGVRDFNSRAVVKKALGFEPALTLDPCLQWPELIRADEETSGEYLAVYGHNFSPDFAAKVRSCAYKHGLKTVSIGYRNSWADEQWLDAGPLEFAAFVAGAQSVATNFFHGCVFSLLNAKPFAAQVTGYRSIKIRELLALVGASAHLTDSQTETSAFEALLSEPLASTIAARMGALRASSGAYLAQALGCGAI